MGIRLVATDLDGTLLRSDGTLSARTARALRAADAAGLHVVFVTARPLRWMTALWDHVGAHGLAIVSNGAAVYDVPARQVVDISGIKREPGLVLVDRIREQVPGSHFALESVSGIALEPGFQEPEEVPVGSPMGPLSEIWTEPALKLMVRHDDLESEQFRAAVVEAVGDLATPTWSVDFLIEISAPGVTKGGALARLCERLGVRREQVIACGDMPNDLPMLTWAGTGVAVANADPSVLEVVERLTASNDDDGVAQVIEALL
ncbi:MAG TPA: Cof-type HAD-IIB family hydrolase [Marmoricola sp.]|nr:Cof-type HAD-IIB family hydrolase [Marmoricola sp.]